MGGQLQERRSLAGMGDQLLERHSWPVRSGRELEWWVQTGGGGGRDGGLLVSVCGWFRCVEGGGGMV